MLPLLLPPLLLAWMAGLPAATVEAASRALADASWVVLSFDDRVTIVSARYLGAPFRLSPLGEGPGNLPDPDPISSLRAFDCVTYVEQVIAASWFADPSSALRALQQLRYAHGEIRYGARNHLMMAQWIPHNVADGFVADVTRQLGADRVETAQLDLVDADYLGPEGRRLGLDAADRALGHFAVPSVPPAQMRELAARVPHGTLLTTLRARRPAVPYRASHVGLVVVVGGERRLRHASQPAGRVVDEPLAAYLERASKPRAWPVTGFHLLAVAKRPPDRLLAAVAQP